MKLKLLILTFSLFSPNIIFSDNLRVDSLLKVLDSEILNSRNYLNKKNVHIDSIKIELKQTTKTDKNKQYQLVADLVEYYKSFNYDSAFVYVNKLISIATDNGDNNQLETAKISLCELLVSGGLFLPALDRLNELNIKELKRKNLIKYYYLYSRLYYDMASYISDKFYDKKYRSLADSYQKKLIDVLDPADNEFLFEAARLAAHENNDFYRSITLLEKLLARKNFSERDNAIYSSTLAYSYYCVGNYSKQKEMLASAAISDIRTTTKETVAILQLAQIMYKEGNLERAHEYIQQALDDATKYNARQRKTQISSILPLIETDRLILEHDKKERFFHIAIIVSILTLFIVILLFIVYIQLNKIKKSRQFIRDANKQLEEVNHQLKESNVIKDRYIVDFLDICSEYISKMSHQNVIVRRIIREKKYDELLRIFDDSTIEEERVQLFKIFDSIFLTLFTTFVEDYNSLLEPKNRFEPKKNELLNTELRIFALIRLGIDDPAFISKFLNCTVNTVYTYRTKAKNKAIVADKKDFEKSIMNIGINFN